MVWEIHVHIILNSFILNGSVFAAGWLFINQSLAFGFFQSKEHALSISDVPMIPAKGEFIAVAVQVFFADVMPRTDNAPFQETEKTFAGVDVAYGAIWVVASVFLDRVVHAVMSLEWLRDRNVDLGLVGIQRC